MSVVNHRQDSDWKRPWSLVSMFMHLSPQSIPSTSDSDVRHERRVLCTQKIKLPNIRQQRDWENDWIIYECTSTSLREKKMVLKIHLTKRLRGDPCQTNRCRVTTERSLFRGGGGDLVNGQSSWSFVLKDCGGRAGIRQMQTLSRKAPGGIVVFIFIRGFT